MSSMIACEPAGCLIHDAAVRITRVNKAGMLRESFVVGAAAPLHCERLICYAHTGSMTQRWSSISQRTTSCEEFSCETACCWVWCCRVVRSAGMF